MGLFSNSSGKSRDEQKADNNRHRALKKAGNNTAKRFREENYASDQINAAIIENEKNVSWWLR